MRFRLQQSSVSCYCTSRGGVCVQNRLDVRSAGSDQLQLWRFFECGQEFSNDLVVDLGGSFYFERISYAVFCLKKKKTETAFRLRQVDAQRKPLFHVPVLPFDLLP